MTESDWATSTDPQLMLSFLRERGASERKLRLFAVACCRRVWHLLADARVWRAVEVAERWADGAVAQEEVTAAVRDLVAVEYDGEGLDATARRTAAKAVYSCCATLPHVAAEQAMLARSAELAAGEPWRAVFQDWSVPYLPEELSTQADLLRDIFGPITPPAFDPSWRTGTAVALARRMYESRDFLLMPVLGDALADAGCPDGDVLEHCRGPGPHVRGCYVVDLVLGQS